MRRYPLYQKLFFFILFFSICLNVSGLAQKEETGNKPPRDPFIPLIDGTGNLREDFTKPIEGLMVPQVNLMGINKIGNKYYALIDGIMVKEGDMFKSLKVEKIDPEKVTVSFGDKIFELKTGMEKK